MIEWVQVQVMAIEGDEAITQDRFGRERKVPTNILRAKGDRPAVGEAWIIDRALGRWLFAAWIDTNVPESPPLFAGPIPLPPAE